MKEKIIPNTLLFLHKIAKSNIYRATIFFLLRQCLSKLGIKLELWNFDGNCTKNCYNEKEISRSFEKWPKTIIVFREKSANFAVLYSNTLPRRNKFVKNTVYVPLFWIRIVYRSRIRSTPGSGYKMRQTQLKLTNYRSRCQSKFSIEEPKVRNRLS
jgi:hypothetical protein